MISFGSLHSPEFGIDIPQKFNVIFEDHIIYQAAYRYELTFVLTNKGLYAFGKNTSNQLGLGQASWEELPRKVPFDKKVVSLAIGMYHALIATEYEVYGTGSDFYGQLGDTRNICRDQSGDRYEGYDHFTLISTFTDPIVKVVCGSANSFVLTTNGCWAFGDNGSGRLGTGTDNHKKSRVINPTEEPIVDVAGGTYITLFLIGSDVYLAGNFENTFHDKPIKIFERATRIAASFSYGLIQQDTKIFKIGTSPKSCVYEHTYPEKVDFDLDVLDISTFGQDGFIISTTDAIYSYMGPELYDPNTIDGCPSYETPVSIGLSGKCQLFKSSFGQAFRVLQTNKGIIYIPESLVPMIICLLIMIKYCKLPVVKSILVHEIVPKL